MRLSFLNEKCSIYSVTKTDTGRYQSKPTYTLNASNVPCRVFSKRDKEFKESNDSVTSNKLFIGKTTVILKPNQTVQVDWRIIDSNLLKYTVEEVKKVSNGRGGTHRIHAICQIIK